MNEDFVKLFSEQLLDKQLSDNAIAKRIEHALVRALATPSTQQRVSKNKVTTEPSKITDKSNRTEY